MALEELIGATLAVGFPGAEPSEALMACLRRTRAQSLVVFARNIASPEQLTRLLAQVQEAIGRRLIVMVDHEGGRWVRFSSGVTRFPAARAAAAARNPAAIEQQGALEARELRALGVQVNLAPCVDVVVEGSDPVIGERSYGAEPALVAQLAAARIRGLQANGAAACAKHFPGLGAVPRDPHQHLPTIPLDRSAMVPHLAPFKAAISADVAMVMSSHVCYPGLGDSPGLPATFSPRLVHDLLRTELGFRGLALTDDLEMGALRTFGSLPEAAVKARRAGHDLLLVCSDLDAAEATAGLLYKSYSNKELSISELEISAKRVADFRKRFSI